MKNCILFFLLIFFSCAEKKIASDNSILSQKQFDKNELQLVLKSVSNDSRCPEGTDCIWAGDVTIKIQVVENLKILETKAMVISSKNLTENISWFSKYYPNQKIKTIQVLPYPKSGVAINPSAYFVKFLFDD
jgi:hypothetical protein